MTITRDLQLSAFEELAASTPVGRMLTSVSQAPTNAELIESIAPLYLDGLVLDVTHGEGGWWHRFRPAGLIATDLDRDRAVSAQTDFTALPFRDRSVDAVAYDPPYIPAGRVNGSTSFNKFYGLDSGRSRDVMDRLIFAGLAECKRVMRRWLLVKCSDYVNGGKFHLGHVAIANAAAEIDLEPWDLLVHHSGTGPGHNLAVQLRARRAHSYLMVYRRRSRT